MATRSGQHDEPGSDSGAPVVVVLAQQDVIAFDLATPIEIFGRTRLADGRAGYRVVVAGTDSEVAAGPLGLRVRHGLDALEVAHTIVVPGLNDPSRRVDPAVTAALRGAHASGTRIASICVGAFTLAQAGLLDGRRATTHWLAADELARRYPLVQVDPAVLFVDEGSVLTSAGAAAGIDLCLHLIARDHGAAVAAAAARSAVAPVARSGGQAQFIDRRILPDQNRSLNPVLEWLESVAHEPVTVREIAGRARLSERSLSRRFHTETGTSPNQWLTRVRIRHAQELLETTDRPIDQVAHDVGFGSASHFRSTFRTATGTTPGDYRRTFNSGDPSR